MSKEMPIEDPPVEPNAVIVETPAVVEELNDVVEEPTIVIEDTPAEPPIEAPILPCIIIPPIVSLWGSIYVLKPKRRGLFMR